MPNALAHASLGALVALALVSIVDAPIGTKMIMGTVAFGFSLLPDIDHPKATARKAYRRVGVAAFSTLAFALLWLFTGAGIVTALAVSLFAGLLLVAFTEKIMPRHRGITHTLKFAVLGSIMFYLLLLLLNVQGAGLIAIAGFAGYASHIALDRIM